MSTTFNPQDAINLATALNHKAPSSTMQVYACNIVNAFIWTAFPWNWTKQALTQITLVDGQQDYSLGGTDLTTFYRFSKIEIQNTSVSPTASRRLNQKNDLSVELVTKGGLETIRFFSWEATINKIRLDYPAAVPSGTTLVLNGEFQKQPTQITGSNLTTAFAAPDHYFQVFVEGLRWKFYELTDDPRAGTTQFVKGRAVNTGQKASFMDAFQSMREAEDFSDGEDVIFPSGGSLGPSRDDGQPRIFG